MMFSRHIKALATVLLVAIVSMCICAPSDALGIRVGASEVYGRNTGAGQDVNINIFGNDNTVIVGQQASSVEETQRSVLSSSSLAASRQKTWQRSDATDDCLEADCTQVTPDQIGEFSAMDDCVLTADQILDHLRGFFMVEASDGAHLIVEDTNVLTIDSLRSAIGGVKVSGKAVLSAKSRANQVRRLWSGAIFYLPQSNKAYAFVVADHNGKTIECVKINADQNGYFKITSIGWVENDNSGANDNLPNKKIATNELWQAD